MPAHSPFLLLEPDKKEPTARKPLLANRQIPSALGNLRIAAADFQPSRELAAAVNVSLSLGSPLLLTPVIPKEKEPEAPSTPKDKEPEAPSRTSYALPGLLPVVPVNRLYKGTYRSRNAPLNWFSDSSLEKVLDPVRLESNLRAVKFARTSSTVAEIEFVHSAGETPVAVCISSLSLPAAAKDYDIEIDVKSVDDNKITVTVKPADHGIGVGVTAFFQTAGLSGEA